MNDKEILFNNDRHQPGTAVVKGTATKKSYHPPKLRRLGHLMTVTLGGSPGGNGDSGDSTSKYPPV